MNLQPFGLFVYVTAFAALAQAQQYKAPVASDGHRGFAGVLGQQQCHAARTPEGTRQSSSADR